MNVWQHPTIQDGDPCQYGFELFVVLHSQQDVARRNAALLVFTAGVSSQLQDFSAEIFQDGCKVHSSADANPRCVAAFFQQPMNAADWESESCSGGTGHCRYRLGCSFLSSARHRYAGFKETHNKAQKSKHTSNCFLNNFKILWSHSLIPNSLTRNTSTGKPNYRLNPESSLK